MDYREIEKRIDELNLDGYKQIKNNDWELPKKLKKWLIDHNFKKIGSGLFSTIYQSDTENFVVKVNDGDIDEGYLKFVDFCQTNKGNPHLPKMGKIKKYEDWYIIFVEKLEPVNIKKLFHLDDYRNLMYFFRSTISYFQGKHTRDEKVKVFYNRLDRYDFDILHSDPYVTQLYDVCELMLEMCNEFGINPKTLDLHENNIMLRGKTVVVTDPLAN